MWLHLLVSITCIITLVIIKFKRSVFNTKKFDSRIDYMIVKISRLRSATPIGSYEIISILNILSRTLENVRNKQTTFNKLYYNSILNHCDIIIKYFNNSENVDLSKVYSILDINDKILRSLEQIEEL